MAPKLLESIKGRLDAILTSGSMPSPRPVIRKHNESNVKSLYIIGDLAGAPVIKLAMQQGYDVIRHIASLPDARSGRADTFDVVIAGAGAAGLNAALEARENGLSHLVLEKGKIAREQELLARRRFHAAQTNLALQAWEAGLPVTAIRQLVADDLSTALQAV